jgi:hypothetical protein
MDIAALGIEMAISHTACRDFLAPYYGLPGLQSQTGNGRFELISMAFALLFKVRE